MEVILLQKVDNLGGLGDTVKVRSGYARNYLFPTGRAAMATPENVAKFEKMRADLERQEVESLAGARRRAEAIAQVGAVTISAKVSQEGKLYGSVSAAEIAEALEAAGVPVERKEVRLPEGPFRELGDYEVELHLYSDVNATLHVTVVPEAS